MSSFVKVYATIVYALASLAFIAIMWLLSVFSNAMIVRYGVWFAFPSLALILWIGILMEKAEQRRLGVKRPLFRWHND